MTHYTGYYFCTRSNWDDKVFSVGNLVSIERESEDYDKLINQKSLYLDDEYNSWRKYNELKPEVFDWLNENVKDEKQGLKGWCCGNKDYNSEKYEGFSLFFYRRKDAKAFIKTWSIHKQPTETYNQNTYVNKVLDTKTNTLKVRK